MTRTKIFDHPLLNCTDVFGGKTLGISVGYNLSSCIAHKLHAVAAANGGGEGPSQYLYSRNISRVEVVAINIDSLCWFRIVMLTIIVKNIRFGLNKSSSSAHSSYAFTYAQNIHLCRMLC